MKRILLLIFLIGICTLSAQTRASIRLGVAFDPVLADSLFPAQDSIDQLLLLGNVLPASARKDSATVRDSIIVEYVSRQKALACPIGFSFESDPSSMIRCGNLDGFDTIDTFALDSLTIRIFSLYSPDTIVKHPIAQPERFDYDVIRLTDEAFAEKDSTDYDILVTNLPKHVITELFEQAPADVILNFDYVPTRTESLFGGKCLFISLASKPRTILTIERIGGETRISRK